MDTQQDCDRAAFRLENVPFRPAPRPLDSGPDRTRQMRLFAGLDCLPGQLDLFPTDGQPERRS